MKTIIVKKPFWVILCSVIIVALTGCEGYIPSSEDPFIQNDENFVNPIDPTNPTDPTDPTNPNGPIDGTASNPYGPYSGLLVGDFTGPNEPQNEVLDNESGYIFRSNGQNAEWESMFTGGYRVNTGQTLPNQTSSQNGKQFVTQQTGEYIYNSAPGIWYMSNAYFYYYKHFYQFDAKPQFPGGVMCAPVAYMLAVHPIAYQECIDFPSDKRKAGEIYTNLKKEGKFDDNVGMYINDLRWYADTYDFRFINATYLRTTERSQTKEFIESTIKDGFPVIVVLNINSTYSRANDVHATNQNGYTYFIDSNVGKGHFILIVGIKINNDGSGQAYYRDPLDSRGVTWTVSYTRLLDSMKLLGSNSYYDAIAIRKKGIRSPSQLLFL